MQQVEGGVLSVFAVSGGDKPAANWAYFDPF